MMKAIEIARRLAELGSKEDACKAYMLALHEQGAEPAEEMESAVYIFQSGGDYRIPYTSFINLYNRGFFREDILSVMNAAFYEPNRKQLQSNYEKNCKLLKKYPYLFRKDFLPFEKLPIRFYPYDDDSYVPFYTAEERFGECINFKNPVVSRNFFKNLENPVLADNVYSQYELEYLNDNVRPSEYIGRENHIYLHYTDWGAFCSHLPCLNLRPLLNGLKIVFLMEDEIARYPIDFKEQFGIDYSKYPVRPVGIREIHRVIWHTQLSSHNGGDFFNEIFDNHPNLLVLPSLMLSGIEETVGKITEILDRAGSAREAMQGFVWENKTLINELYRMPNRTEKDILVAIFLRDMDSSAPNLDRNSRIAPVLFLQPHFPYINYQLQVDAQGRAALFSEQYEKICRSPVLRNFKYIKTFTPMRRVTTSYGAGLRFSTWYSAEQEVSGKITVPHTDPILDKILNRSFMIDGQDRLYKDSVLVRFEDGKLNPGAVFTALAAFLDIPYTESMTYCSLRGEQNPEGFSGNARGFDPAAIYRTYDEYVNDTERYFLEYFMRDVYEYYGYGLQYYDGAPVDEARAEELIAGFSTADHYIRESWKNFYRDVTINEIKDSCTEDEAESMPVMADAAADKLLSDFMTRLREKRLETVKVLLRGLQFVSKNGQPLRMMPKLELDPALLENPLYH